MMGLQTYVVRVAARREWAAVQKLKPLCHDVVMPLFWVAVDPRKGITRGKRQAGEVCAKARPLFPGYLFPRFEGEPDFHALSALRYDDGNSLVINSWLRTTRHSDPHKLTPVESLMLKTVLPTFPGKIKRLNNERFKPGQKIRAVDGPFTGCMLEVEHDSGKEHIEALHQMFGRLSSVRIDRKWLEAA